MKAIQALLFTSLLDARSPARKNTATTPAPSGGSAGAEGIGHPNSPLSNPDELEDWNESACPNR